MYSMGYITGYLRHIGILQEKLAGHLKIYIIQATEHENMIESFEVLPGCMSFHGAPQHSLI